MKIKKLLLSLLLIKTAFCYAGMAVTDYGEAGGKSENGYWCLESTYVVRSSGMAVYESPSVNSKKIAHLPLDTQVLLLSVNGPASRMKGWWHEDDDSEWDGTYFDEHWAAILLPPNLRKNGNTIGWIENANQMWWSPSEKFITWSWTAESLEGYLKNSIWYVTLKFADNESDYMTGICVFDEGEYSLFFYEDGKRRTRRDSYSVNSKDSIILFDEEKKLNINRFEFNFTDSDGYYNFKKINLSSLDYIDEYLNDKEKLEQARSLVYKASKKYFRMFTTDYYRESNIYDYAYTYNDKGLLLLAITSGVTADIDKDNPVTEFAEYWGKTIDECERSVKKGNYTFPEKKQKPIYLRLNHSYLTSDNLRLRKKEDTSSDIITTMEKGTEVKILEFGKLEVIEDSVGYWVYVQVKGTKYKGWCFGGFLEEKN